MGRRSRQFEPDHSDMKKLPFILKGTIPKPNAIPEGIPTKENTEAAIVGLDWKSPVLTVANLPVNAGEGDCRMVTNTGQVYIFSSEGRWNEFKVLQ